MSAHKPAYPTSHQNQYWGLTKRELAILMAMQGLCANHYRRADGDYANNFHPDRIASDALAVADATLAAMEAE